MSNSWRFAIDVGGTFTDVLAHDPAGEEHVLKVLSTGCFRGVAGMGSTSRVLADEQRAARRADLWAGFRLRLVATDSPSVPIVASDPDGTLHLASPLSRLGPGAAYELSSGEPAPVAAIRRRMERRLGEALGSVDVRLGSTWGTNALLERRGASTTLAITEGFGDLLRIGYQDRPKLFELNIRKPEPLFEHVIEIGERLSATGAVLRAPDAAAVEEQLRAVRLAGARTLAVCLLHACVNDIHEQLVARIAARVGFEHVSVSSHVAPAPRMVPRGETTVIDAYLSPITRSYVQTLRRYLPDARLRLMTSAGGLVSADSFTAKDSVLSGPAGGVVGCAAVAREAGLPLVIGFDMGGTSTDVSRIDSGAPGFEYQYEAEKAGVRIVAPMLAVETVAAGGGSICRFDGQKLLVGPESAGAHPGPACYGHGGPLALTDINLLLGRIQPAHFPFPLDRRAAEQRLAHVVQDVSSATGRAMTPVEAAEGFVTIANANMADAIKKISAARGYDVREYALVSFGGAAGQHACALARRLGMRTVLSAPHAGILSAVGLSRADVMRHAERAVLVRLGAAPDNPTAWFAPLEARVRSELTAEGFDVERIELVRSIDLRYVGQNTTLNLPIDPAGGADWSARLIDAFHAAHERTYGFRQTAREIEVVTARVAGLARIDVPPRPLRTAQERRPAPDSYQDVIFGGAPRSTPVHLRGQLAAGDIIDGPALIVDSFGTIVVEPEWVATITARLDVLLECSAN
ncbi:MAG TPA: hydantoinase/oxoprolinase family protein, partial [Phycisphaerae bacterium]